MTDLKRCPFCDSVADLHIDEAACPAVICAHCDCQTTWYKPGCEEDAVAAWNLRATPADHSSYVLQMLVAAGHISQAKVDEALAIAAKIPGVGEAQSVRDAWISVDERLPEHEAIVLATGWRKNEMGGERYTTIACFHQEGSFYEQDTGDDLYPPTHWMPLPDDPK